MDLEVRSAWVSGLLALAGVTAVAHATPPTHYLTWINDDDRSVVMVEAAPVGSGAFTSLGLSAPLLGGREGQATVTLPPGPCVRDLRVVYRDTSMLTVTAWNTCRNAVIHIGAARRAALRQNLPA